MNIYEKNMECMKIHHKKLHKLLKDTDLSLTTQQLDEIHSVNAKDGEQAILIKYNAIEYRLNSVYYPIQEAEKWVEQYNFQNMENVISMFGFGNGIFTRAITKKMGVKDTLLIYEPCHEIFLHVLHNYDITDILTNKRIKIAIEDLNKFDFHHGLMNAMNINNLRYQIMCVHPKYDNIFQESCILFWKELKDIYIHTKMNINTVMAFGKRLIDNSLDNIKFVTNSSTIIELKDIIPKGVPAIVVAAGPSVRNQIEYLKAAKGKAVIIAVDRVLDYLLDEGVEPDFIATVDPKKPVEYFSRRTDLTIPLICFMESNNEIFEVHKGRKIICNCSEYFSEIYRMNHKIPPRMITGASVATLAFTACIALEFENIILVGQDLAYDGDMSHAGSINEANLTGRDVMIEDINGQMVRSRLDWKEFATWYEDMLIMFPHITVIDAKDKGAKIKGTIVMPLMEALDKYSTQEDNFSFNIEDLEPTFTEEVFDDIKNYLQEGIYTLYKIKTKSKSAIKACDSLIKEAQKNMLSKKTEDNHKKLNNVIKYIIKQPIYRLMDLYITATSAQYISEMYQFTEDIQDDSIQTYRNSKHIFEAMLEAVEYIEPRLEKTISKM